MPLGCALQVRQALADKVSKERVGTELRSMIHGMPVNPLPSLYDLVPAEQNTQMGMLTASPAPQE